MHLVKQWLQEVFVLQYTDGAEANISTKEIASAVAIKNCEGATLTVSFWIFPAREEWSPTC